MERKLVITLGAICVIALAIGILVPAKLTEPQSNIDKRLPWNILQSGTTTEVFGLRLGESTMEEGLTSLKASAEVSLFVSENDEYIIEAFFDDVNLAGLGAKVVLAADVSEQDMQAMFKRGLRISTLGSGTRKVALTPEDLLQVRASPIASITYLPKIQLQPELIQKRFGEPAQRIKEKDSDAIHWLYPELGLDVTLSEKEKDVLQYVSPRQFSSLTAPLKENTEPLP